MTYLSHDHSSHNLLSHITYSFTWPLITWPTQSHDLLIHMTTHHMTYSVTWLTQIVTWCTWSPDIQCSCMLCARNKDFCGVWDHHTLPPSLLCLLMSGVYPPHYTWSAFNIPQYCYAMLIGASVSEPLSSDLNVNFVCLSVCLSVCHGWTVNLP